MTPSVTHLTDNNCSPFLDRALSNYGFFLIVVRGDIGSTRSRASVMRRCARRTVMRWISCIDQQIRRGVLLAPIFWRFGIGVKAIMVSLANAIMSREDMSAALPLPLLVMSRTSCSWQSRSCPRCPPATAFHGNEGVEALERAPRSRRPWIVRDEAPDQKTHFPMLGALRTRGHRGRRVSRSDSCAAAPLIVSPAEERAQAVSGKS